MTLSELTENIQTYLESRETTFVATIPTFVRNAEQRIMYAASLPAVRRTSTRAIVAGTKFIAVPPDFISVFSITASIGSETNFLLNKDHSFLQEAYGTSQGLPQVYALFDANYLYVAPVPNALCTLEMNYEAVPDSLVDNPDGTWLSKKYSAALLAACLVEGNVFLKGEADLTERYEAQFSAQFVNVADLARNKARKDAYRAGQQRIEGPQ